MYALIQTGHAIFGVGETIEAARADAAQWLGSGGPDEDGNFVTPEEIAAAVPVFRDPRHMYASTMYGDMGIVPCSAELAAYVLEHGTTDYDDSGDELRLPSEVDE